MPPSPALRRSPGRVPRADNHKRGRSLEGGILFREKDEDLALFNEVQTRERDNFLIQSNDDFEDTFSTKLRYFTDHKLGISIPVRGESSDLLNAEEEKNDYDWLLTPPDTPLFTSLDDETPPDNLAWRGRPRSQPISISRSSTMEKSHRSTRGSPSPNRLSPSPRSSNSSTLQARGRASSAPHTSPTRGLRPTTPLRRPSPPPTKPSPPAPRSTTPTPRRVSTSSISTVRGVSPVRTSRGNSASPKVRAWQSNIPGFSSEAPPNLRTSLADRPASYVRGSSPASRNGRQSMSPTASRSASSSHSHERDRFSSYSKGSIASSGDDDVDSLLSIPVGSSERSSTRRVGSLPNNKAPAFSKKASRIVASSSAPKRSFDLALRQMDHRKSPQNMFRPLLSSVPSSTFHAGKTSFAQRAIISRNSSITTSSNASSDQATSGAHDTEGTEQNHEDLTSTHVEAPYADAQDEVFIFDKADGLNESIGHQTQGGSLGSQHGDCSGGVSIDGPEVMEVCSNCRLTYCTIESIEGDIKLCPDCRRSDVSLTIGNALTATIVGQNSPRVSTKINESDSFDGMDHPIAEPESPGAFSMMESRAGQHEHNIKESHTSYSEPIWNFLSTDSMSRALVEESDQKLPDGDTRGQQTVQSIDQSIIKVETSERAGISVLLNRSSSGKGAVLQNRSFTANSISYDDPSYVRDVAYSLRSSIGHGSVSASSSVDLGSYRQTEARVQRQLSGRKSELENHRHDMNTRHLRTGSSLSGTSSHTLQVQNDVDVNLVATREQLLSSENMEEDDECSDVENIHKCRTMDDSTSESSNHIPNLHLGHSPVTSCLNSEESTRHEDGEDLTNNKKNPGDVEASVIPPESSSVMEENTPGSSVDGLNVADVPSQTSLGNESEIELENAHLDSPGTQFDVSSSSKGSIDELLEPHVTATSDMDVTISLVEPDVSNHGHGTLVESTVMVEGKDRSRTRSLTLEEATDAILFCSSIVHNIAYDAATIAIEKEDPVPLEGSQPTVTILGQANPERKDPPGRITEKHPSKAQKARQRRVEADAKPPSSNKNDENTDLSTTRIVGVYNNDKSMKAPPPKLESKCNCTIM